MSGTENNVVIPDTVIGEESKNSTKYGFSKFEHDLYHEEDDVAEKVIQVKRISLPSKGEKWKIFSDSKLIFTIEGSKLTKKEKDFLRSVDGVNFLIAQFKQGIKSLNALKAEIKKKIKQA